LKKKEKRKKQKKKTQDFEKKVHKPAKAEKLRRSGGESGKR